MSAPAIVDPRPFRFSGKEWSEVTVMGGEGAQDFARRLVTAGIEFHHDPPVAAGTTVHRFLVAAASVRVQGLAESMLEPGIERARGA